MRVLSALSIIALAALGFKTPAAAETSEEAYWRVNLSFFDDIVHRCQSNSAEFLNDVCKSVATDLSFLTATADIKSIDCSDCSWLEFYERSKAAGIQKPLRIGVLHATTKGEIRVGGFLQVTALANFEDIVCEHTVDCEKVSINPDVALWMRYMTFSMPMNPTHVATLANNAEGYMKELVTLYLKTTR